MTPIGIGIPVYNGEKYLSEAIESALNQTVQADEVFIFIHDSTDRSLQIAESFAPNVRIVEDNSSLTIGQAWNAIYTHSFCDYVVMLHADDRLHPDSIKILKQAIAEDSHAGLIFGRTRIISAGGDVVKVNYSVQFL